MVSVKPAAQPRWLVRLPTATQTSFPNCTAGTAGCGNTDGFVAIYSSALALLHHTYIGGGGNDQVNGVAVDIWGNIYATGFATPAVAPNFPVTNGIASSAVRPNWDAATASPLNAAVAFVAKWACTTGSPAIGVPSPAFGVTNGVNSQMPICGGGNNLKTLSNSALFGGAGSFVNPQQTALGQNGVTEAGLAIAVDQNGWGQTGVAGVPPSGFVNAAGFPDIVPNSENGNNCNTTGTGNGFGVGRCVSSATGTNGGFQPGLSGPHVYVVGNTANRNFVNSLVFNASCTAAPAFSSVAVPALCPVPEVWGGGVTATGALPTIPFCDPLGNPGGGGYPSAGPGVCPAGGEPLGDIRIKPVTGGVNSGQTQGWLASFQFPAVTQAVVNADRGPASTTTTTLNPPTIPNYIILQPTTCPPPGLPACIQGDVATATHASSILTTDPAPPANFGCGATCPNAFLGSWNAVAVDSDQQVYVLGQVGMSPGAAAATPALFGTGAPNRLALEMERISPYANTPAGNVSASYPNFCSGPGNAPCAIPEILFPFSGTTPAGSTTSFLVDVGTGVGGGAGSIFNSSFGQILPGAPPYPNPNQAGGLGNGIAVNLYREAFFAGTTTVLTAPGAAVTLPVTADTDVAPSPGPHVQDLDITGTISGYSALPACALSGGGGTGATCSLAAGQSAGDLALTNGVLVAGPNCTAALPPAVHGCGAAPGASVFFCSSCITAGGSGYSSSPTVTFTPAPANNGALTYLATSPLSAPTSAGSAYPG